MFVNKTDYWNYDYYNLYWIDDFDNIDWVFNWRKNSIQDCTVRKQLNQWINESNESSMKWFRLKWCELIKALTIIINYQLLLLIIMRKLHNSLTYDNDNDEYKFVNANLHNVFISDIKDFFSIYIFSKNTMKIELNQWNWIEATSLIFT